MPSVQPIIIKTLDQTPARELGIGDIIIQALGLTGGILLASLLLGAAVGVLIIWYRTRQVRARADGEAGDQIRLRLEPPVRTERPGQASHRHAPIGSASS